MITQTGRERDIQPRPRTSPPIEEHGVVGNQETVAFVTNGATVDFLCLPRFDAPSVFARLIDHARGGAFDLRPSEGGYHRSQRYLPDTNLLRTRFASDDAIVEVIDFMPCHDATERALVRRIDVVRGESTLTARCAPRFDYARRDHAIGGHAHRIEFHPEGGRQPPLRLLSTVPLAIDGCDATARFTLRAGQSACFVLDWGADAPGDPDALRAWVEDRFERTARHWRAWSARTDYAGRWPEMVRRSALTLGLLTSRADGAMVAAPTFGLPEDVGGERNWDYRYSWIRDSAFATRTLTRLGHIGSAHGFMRWVLDVCVPRHHGGRLHVMYAVDGDGDLTERCLDSLDGYHGSRPVRIGNGAHDQLQLDIYGPLMDTAWLAVRHGERMSHDEWNAMGEIIDWVCDHWQCDGHGIWEMRGAPRAFLSSRFMCWLALDRALRIADHLSVPAPTRRWVDTRNAIYDAVFREFWSPERNAFVQARGAEGLDASALLMPLVDFVSSTDPRWLSTLDAIAEDLAWDVFVYRYSPKRDVDGLEGREGTFTACSFWYIECLSRAGRVDEARHLFDKLLGYANPLGLFAEELGHGGQQLGNFPQALTHLALVEAALRLDADLDARAR